MRLLVCWLALTRNTAVFLLLTLLASAAGSPTSGAHIFRDAKHVNLSGKWRLNHQLSAFSAEPAEGDVFPEKASSSFEDWPGVTREQQLAVADLRLRELFEASKALEIFGKGWELTVNATGSALVVITRTFYTDGRSTEYNLTSGDRGESQARWTEQKLIVETKTARGSSLTETFEISPDRNHLIVSLKLVGGQTRPILIRRVYDRETNQRAING